MRTARSVHLAGCLLNELLCSNSQVDPPRWPRFKPSCVFPSGDLWTGQDPSPGCPTPPPTPQGPGTYLAGAARPPGRHMHSRCNSSAVAAGTQSRPGSAPPGRRRGAASAGAAGSGPRGAAGARQLPRPAGRGKHQRCSPAAASGAHVRIPALLGAVRCGQVPGPL